MGELCVLGYLGTILLGSLFGNFGRDLYRLNYFKLVIEVLNVILGSIIVLIA
jgi:uncharacterized membrane protein YeaQ/YmgE (transglycosylase-associated protein family)